MTQALMVVPAGIGTGLTTAVLGLFHAMDRQGIEVHFFKPIGQPIPGDHCADRTVALLQPSCNDSIAEPISMRHAEHLVSEGRGDELLEEIVARYEQSCPQNGEVVIIEGIVPTANQPYATRINKEIAKALDAQVVLVAAPGADTAEAFEDHIDITARAYGGIRHKRLIGCFLNKLDAPLDNRGKLQPELSDKTCEHRSLSEAQILEKCTIFGEHFPVLGYIPWRNALNAPRVSDVAKALNAEFINRGELEHRRAHRVTLCARTVANAVDALLPGTLVVTPGDRDDIILATCLAALNGVDLAGLLLTGDLPPDSRVMALCENAQTAGLPILSVESNTWQAAMDLQRLDNEMPLDDQERLERIKDATARYIDPQWLQSYVDSDYQRRLSPPAFRYQLIERARRANTGRIPDLALSCPGSSASGRAGRRR